MNEQNKIWRILSIIAIGLIIVNIIAYSLLWNIPYIVYGDFDFDLGSKIMSKYLIITLCLILALIFGFVFHKIKYLRKYEISFKRGFIISILIFYSITLVSRVDYLIKNRKVKKQADNTLIADFVEYDTQDFIVYFDKSEIIDFCDDKLKEYPDLGHLNLFKDIVSSSDSCLRIKLDYVYLPDTFDLIQNFETPDKFDTIQIYDFSAKVNSYRESLDFALVELLKKGRFRVYEKEKREFVNFIYYQTIHSGFENVDFLCYYPDGRIFINNRLVWGL